MDYWKSGKFPYIGLVGDFDWQERFGITDPLEGFRDHYRVNVEFPWAKDIADKARNLTVSQPVFPNLAESFLVTSGVQESLKHAFEVFRDEREQLFRSAQENLDYALHHIVPPIDFGRLLLPPNLRDYSDEVSPAEVLDFVEGEAIPMYLVPRGRTAIRLIHAETRSERRAILGDRYTTIIDDCADVLEACEHKIIRSEVEFAVEALEAMRAGYNRTAQGMLTVLLDSIVGSFYPGKEKRTITNRKKEHDPPELLLEMSIRESLVWLPIWNAHEAFWPYKGDPVPHYYSRHASVHAVSRKQFNKRNCVQALMLVTSLLGYANHLACSLD